MGKPKWVGIHQQRLYWWPLAKLVEQYPDYSKDTLKGKKYPLIKKVKEGKIPMPEKPPDSNERHEGQLEPEGKLVKGWDVSAFDHNAGEFVTTRNYSYEYAPDPSEIAEQFPPVEPAKITPTRRKAVKRLAKMILVYGDGQVEPRRIIDPITDEMRLVDQHNEPMYNILKQVNADLMPETTVNLGDFGDSAGLSTFTPDSNHYHQTLGPAMRYIHDFYAQLRADNPKGHHVEVDSNHAARITKRILEKNPALYNFVRPGEKYPAFTYYSMANLEPLGIDFISGYGAAEFVYGEEYGNPIVFKHGTFSSSSPGATVRKEAAENPTVNIVRGHGHSDEEIRRTTRDGRQLFYKQLGSSCLNNGPVPGYRSAVDDHNEPVPYHNQGHQNTLAIIEDYQDGTYTMTTVDVINGIAKFRDKIYDGNEK